MEGKQNSKGTALVYFAHEGDFATHEFGEPFGDGQPKAGPTVFTGHSAIYLAERLKDVLLGVERDARASILHINCPTGCVQRVHTNGNGARRGEFYRVPDQVDQNLLETCRIAYQRIR